MFARFVEAVQEEIKQGLLQSHQTGIDGNALRVTKAETL